MGVYVRTFSNEVPVSQVHEKRTLDMVIPDKLPLGKLQKGLGWVQGKKKALLDERKIRGFFFIILYSPGIKQACQTNLSPSLAGGRNKAIRQTLLYRPSQRLHCSHSSTPDVTRDEN